jgi:hypothetical protein
VLGCQGAEQHPDSKARVKIKETGNKGGEMPRFEEGAFHQHGSQVQRTALPDTSGCEPPLARRKLQCCKRRPPLGGAQSTWVRPRRHNDDSKHYASAVAPQQQARATVYVLRLWAVRPVLRRCYKADVIVRSQNPLPVRRTAAQQFASCDLKRRKRVQNRRLRGQRGLVSNQQGCR